MNEQKTPKIIYSVTLANYKTNYHTYDLPKNLQEVQSFAGFMASMITNAMSGEKKGPLYFNNPRTWYNPDYVVKVSFETFGAEEFEELINEAHKPKDAIGFVKDRKK